MAASFLQGRWRRVVTASVALSLSIAWVNTPKLANGQESSGGSSFLSGRTIMREADSDDQYPGLTIVKAGNSSSSIRKQALQDLSLERLGPQGQKKAQAILKNVGMFRHLPTISFECDPEIYRYFLNNPDVAVSTWRAMGISQFQLQQTGANQYRADAGDGSIGDIEILLQTPKEIIIVCDGAFKSPLLPKPIVARSLMRVQSSFVRNVEGKVTGTHNGEVYVEFPSHAVEAAAKVISPVSHVIADRNFKQMTLFVHLMSQAMVKNPAWIEQTGQKMEGVSDEKKLEFFQAAAKCYADSKNPPAIVTTSQTSPPSAVQLPAPSPPNRPTQTASQAGSATRRN